MIILIHMYYLSHFSQKHYICDIPLSQRQLYAYRNVSCIYTNEIHFILFILCKVWPFSNLYAAKKKIIIFGVAGKSLTYKASS